MQYVRQQLNKFHTESLPDTSELTIMIKEDTVLSLINANPPPPIKRAPRFSCTLYTQKVSWLEKIYYTSLLRVAVST